jgi:S1-C subfamily serine protease
MTNLLSALSANISNQVSACGTFVCAIRTATNRHITGLLVQGDTIATLSQLLPPLEFYSAFFAAGHVVTAKNAQRDPATDIAVLRLDAATGSPPLGGIMPLVGSIAVIIGTELDGSLTARIAIVHRLTQTPAYGLTPVLDVRAGSVEPGSVILDAEGRLIGLVALTGDDVTMAIPAAPLQRLTATQCVDDLTPPVAAPPLPPPPVAHASGRAWLGVSLQPITVPEHLVARAGQRSGRMVMSVTEGGPADKAGLAAGDVLLTLNGNSTSGPNALRALLSGEKVGTLVEVKLLRDGALIATQLTVGSQPA